jgi:hypothetical protein
MIKKGFFKATINLKCVKCGGRGDLITNNPGDLNRLLNSWRWTIVGQPICERCSEVPHREPTLRQALEMPPRPAAKPSAPEAAR